MYQGDLSIAKRFVSGGNRMGDRRVYGREFFFTYTVILLSADN